MRVSPERRRAPLAGDEGALQKNIALGSNDNPEDKPARRTPSTRRLGPGEIARLAELSRRAPVLRVIAGGRP